MTEHVKDWCVVKLAVSTVR